MSEKILNNVKAVFIDIDNTLLDFNKCANECIRLSFEKYDLPFSSGVFPVFKKINDGLWLQIELGTLTKKRLHEIRFNKVLQALGIEFDGTIIEQEFLSNLKVCAIPVEGALELIRYLARKYVVCTASNSFYNQQVNRLTSAKMYHYVDHMFISEILGKEKPTKEFFDECFNRLEDIKVNEVVMIGDSLTADMKGGKQYGITTIWFNPNGEIPNEDCDYTVKDLLEIKNYL